jgi:hypothetical protein
MGLGERKKEIFLTLPYPLPKISLFCVSRETHHAIKNAIQEIQTRTIAETASGKFLRMLGGLGEAGVNSLWLTTQS